MTKKTGSLISWIGMGLGLLVNVLLYVWQLPFVTNASVQMSGSTIFTIAILGIGTGISFSDWWRYRKEDASSINLNRGQK